MTSTPTSRKTRSRANTPGDGSVASVVSQSSTSSYKPGVPWHTQKALAEKLEALHPIAKGGNPAQLLLDSSSHALSKLLNTLIEEDIDNAEIYGLRGSPLRKKITDCVAHWKKKTPDNYSRTVLLKLGVQQKVTKKGKAKKKKPQKQLSFEFSSSEDEAKAPTTKKTEVPQNIVVTEKPQSAAKMSQKAIMELAPTTVAAAAGVDFVGRFQTCCLFFMHEHC